MSVLLCVVMNVKRWCLSLESNFTLQSPENHYWLS